jgi:hypothetical protein
MNTSIALIVAGIIFIFVAFMHLMRFIFKIEITIAGKKIPYWISLVGFVIPLLLSIWMFLAS